ncbi:MAG: thioredoxin [Candidatus Azobacteroides sp.]|nr:thioredoxin [Candidatus Azobacteroides sp.]
MESFKEIINGEKPVLVDFFATWCGPCKAMAPTIEAIGKELQGQARVLKIDIDKNQEAAAQYQIQSVPTLIIFKKGAVQWRASGAMDKASLMEQIKNFLD